VRRSLDSSAFILLAKLRFAATKRRKQSLRFAATERCNGKKVLQKIGIYGKLTKS